MSAGDLATGGDKSASEPPLVRIGLAFARWAERWFPDPLLFAFLAVIAVFCLALLTGERADEVVEQAGGSFWVLAPFTMQMAMVVIGGYVVAAAPLVRRAIRRIAAIPSAPRAAVALVAAFAVATSLLSWGLSLIFSAQLVRELARRLPSLDYRAAGAAAYLGLGVTWALGLSSSAAMLMATPSSLPASLRGIGGVIPLTQTLLSWQNLVMIGVLGAMSIGVAYVSAPSAQAARTAADLGIALDEPEAVPPKGRTPAEWLEYNPVLSWLIGGLLLWYLVRQLSSPRGIAAALELNTYNLIFITVGLILHGRPVSFLRAVTSSVPAAGGVLIQFPFYAMILGMIANTGLSAKIAQLFVNISGTHTYALLVAAYSSILGVFIPSGGSKWVIEAPYVLQAAQAHHVHLGWVVQIYNAAEALPNLINPFWMLPLLGILRCRARDLVGYGMLQLIVLLPVCYLLCWWLAFTFPPSAG